MGQAPMGCGIVRKQEAHHILVLLWTSGQVKIDWSGVQTAVVQARAELGEPHWAPPAGAIAEVETSL